MEKKPIIKLRAYRGREINYDANGNIKNENNLVSLDYGSKIWALFMKNLPLNGYCKVVVEKAFKETSNGYEPIEDLKVYQKEIDEAFTPKKEVALTSQEKSILELQKQNQELNAKIEAFMNGEKHSKAMPKEENNPTDELSELRAEYERVVGKPPHHLVKAEKLQEIINKTKK